MAGNEWWNAERPARRRKNGGSMVRGFTGGLVALVVAAIAPCYGIPTRVEDSSAHSAAPLRRI
jgi:hypothetical protein